MNSDNQGKLAVLLREALNSVTITHDRFGSISHSDFRQMVSKYRYRYEPTLQINANLYDIQIQDTKAEEAILNLLRNELKLFLRNDKNFFSSLSASSVIVVGAERESPIEAILSNLSRATIVDGPDNAAKAFYASINRGYFLFHRYYLLTGIKVESEVRVLDGISLIPLPNNTVELPGYLPALSDVGPEAFRSKTLLKIEVSVPLTLHEPADGYALPLGPWQRFRTRVRSADAKEFDTQRFLQALTLVGEQPVQDAMMWRHFGDDEIFDVRRVIGFDFMSPSNLGVTTTSAFSETQVMQAVGLHNKIFGLSQDVLNYLKIPFDRWKKSKMLQDHVDKMIDLGIAFESFFLGDNNREVTFRFSLRGALYLEQEIEARRRLIGELRDIYKYRSIAVHEGRLPDKVKVNGENVSMRQFIERSQDLLKRCLLKVIESGQLPDWSTIELGGGERA